jgi:hypothetical protein
MVQSAEGEVVDRWPVDDERRWLKEIEWPLEEQKIDLLRQCVNRQRPFGKIESQGEMARLFELESKFAPGRETESREQKVACLFSQLRRFVH